MASTGAKLPSSGVSVSSSPWSDNAWVNPGNVTAIDTTYASVTASTFDTGDQTYRLRCTGFDFSAIPDGSTINGITVKVWNAVLTADEFERERLSLYPRRIKDLHACVLGIGQGAASALRDMCGPDWTLTGTITYDDSHPSYVAGGAGRVAIPQYTVASGIPVLSAPSMSSITATTAVPRVTLTF